MVVDVGGMVPGAAAAGDALAAGVGHLEARVVLVPRAVAPVRVTHRTAAFELNNYNFIYDFRYQIDV